MVRRTLSIDHQNVLNLFLFTSMHCCGVVDKASSRSHEHSSSQDISSFSKNLYDDTSLRGLSFLLDSEGESYQVDDDSYEFLQADLQEVSVDDDLSRLWAEPVDANWKNEVATAMDAFRSCRMDHDDIVAFPDRVEIDDLAQKLSGRSKEVDQLEEIKNWRKDFLATDEVDCSSSSAYSTISCFRFP